MTLQQFAIQGQININIKEDQKININLYQVEGVQILINNNTIINQQQIYEAKLQYYNSNITLVDNEQQKQMLQDGQQYQVKLIDKIYNLKKIDQNQDTINQKLYSFLRIQDLFQSLCRYSVIVNSGNLIETQFNQTIDIFGIRQDNPINQIFNLYGANEPLLIYGQRTSLCINGLIQEECKQIIPDGYSTFNGILFNQEYINKYQQNQPQQFLNQEINSQNQQDVNYNKLGQYYDQQNNIYNNFCNIDKIQYNYTYCIELNSTQNDYFQPQNQLFNNRFTGCLNTEFINTSSFQQSLSQKNYQLQCSTCEVPKGAFLNYFCENCLPPYYYESQLGQCKKCLYFANQSYQEYPENFLQCINIDYGCNNYKYYYEGEETFVLDDKNDDQTNIISKQIRCMDQCPLPYKIDQKQCSLCSQQEIIHYKQYCEQNESCLFDNIQNFPKLVPKNDTDYIEQYICYGNDMDDLNKDQCQQYTKLQTKYRCLEQCQNDSLYFIDYFYQCLYTICNDNSILDSKDIQCKLIDQIDDQNILFKQKNTFQIYQDQLNNITNLVNIQSMYKSITQCNQYLQVYIEKDRQLCLFCQNYLLVNDSIFNNEYDYQCVDQCPEKYNQVLQENELFNQKICIVESQNCIFQDLKLIKYNNTCISTCQHVGEQYYKNILTLQCTNQRQSLLYLSNQTDGEQTYQICDDWMFYNGNDKDIYEVNQFTCSSQCDIDNFLTYIFYSDIVNATLKYCFLIRNDSGSIGQYNQSYFFGIPILVSNNIKQFIDINPEQDSLEQLNCKTYILDDGTCSLVDDCNLKFKLFNYNQDIKFQQNQILSQYTFQQYLCTKQNDIQDKKQECASKQLFYDEQNDICQNCQYYFNQQTQECQDQPCDIISNYNISTQLQFVQIQFCMEEDQCKYLYKQKSQYFYCVESCQNIIQVFQYKNYCFTSCKQNNLLTDIQQKRCYEKGNCIFQQYKNGVKTSFMGEIECKQQCQDPYAINELTTPLTCHKCTQYLELLKIQTQQCMNQYDCKYKYNSYYCGLYIENEEQYKLVQCQIILFNQNICDSVNQTLQNEQQRNYSTQLECYTLNDDIQLVQNQNSQYCQISCINQQNEQKYYQKYVTYTKQQQKYPICQDTCDGIVSNQIINQNLTVCYDCNFYQMYNYQCLDYCLKYFENKTCSDYYPTKCAYYQGMCYDKCPKGMLNEEYQCVKLNQQAKFGISIGVILFIFIIFIVVLFIIQHYQYQAKKKEIQLHKFDIQMLRSSRYQLQYEQTIV